MALIQSFLEERDLASTHGSLASVLVLMAQIFICGFEICRYEQHSCSICKARIKNVAATHDREQGCTADLKDIGCSFASLHVDAGPLLLMSIDDVDT